ncbi:MAG: DEAD/DEAH box helicase [Deltaproteobacteria bacterium]|nr:DEAD/DEAH box helicase [Candidatus Anaeroferrophillus wilburensis]MBN2888525.1 DEAD/DEAH box helicase [Deltaproteobacteria bacterium]
MSFTAFTFHPQIQTALDACGYESPTPIQAEGIPPVLAGRDLLGLAQTGTGKTAAFALPILQRLYAGPRNKVRALIIAPTRELAEQIHEYFGKMAVHTHLRSIVVYGGVSRQAQVNKIQRGAEIVVACPGRLLDLVNDKVVNLSAVEMLVLDEADHMFDKGFLPDIRRILRNLPRQRQTLVFSATMPKEIRSLAEDILTNPVTVQIDHAKPVEGISHVFYQVEQQNKISLLKKILQEKDVATALVFTRTKHKAKNLALQLQKTGCKATSLQGNLSQQKRQLALDGFKRGTYNILVATDIAARGIDVSGISHVINFDMPSTAETYTHRTGRTGRASCTGTAFTFASSDDRTMVRALERTLGSNLVYEKSADFQPTSRIAGENEARQRPAPRTGREFGTARGKRSSQRSRPALSAVGLATRA